VLAQSRIAIDPNDWFVDKIDHAGIVRSLRDRWYREARGLVPGIPGSLEKEAAWFERYHRQGALRGLLDVHHIAPGWERLFAGGLSALSAEAKANAGRPSTTESQRAFYEAVQITIAAACDFAKRYARLAEEMIPTLPEHEPRLSAIARACRRVPREAPESLHEALQCMWFVQVLTDLEGETIMSFGHFDRMLFPYYEADLAAGRLTREQAKELLKFFLFKFNAASGGAGDSAKNVTLGGQCRDGSNAANELTHLVLEARAEANSPEPKFSVRFFPESPDRLYRQTADLIRSGQNSFVLFNDVPAVQALQERGKNLEDARSYLSIGCYEPAVDGREAASTMNLIFNLAKGVELALHDGRDPLSGEQLGPHTGDPEEFEDFDAFFRAYQSQMEYLIDTTVEYLAVHERQWPRINPSPFLATTIDDCLAEGKDIGEGGARYNSVGCVGLALANAVDSLLAVKKTVYEEKRFTIGQIVKAIDDDFDGNEPMRAYLLNRVPKWGNGDDASDLLARRVATMYCDHIHSHRNARGGKCQAALFSLVHRRHFGSATGALPDGRPSGQSLSPGVGAMAGMDKNGITALVNSVTNLDFTKTPNGSVLDVMIHPSAVEGKEGLDAFVSLLKTYFAQGGYAIQCNVLSEETLRDAQEHPEKYAGLQIRVSGWSVYWNSLAREEQDHFISRNVHAL